MNPEDARLKEIVDNIYWNYYETYEPNPLIKKVSELENC